MLNIVVVSITYRTLTNIAAALQLLAGRGARCGVIWIPTSQRIVGQLPARFGFDVRLDASGVGPKDKAATARLREQVRELLLAERPDLVVSDDMTNWPNRLIREVVDGLPDRPWHVAWQHGLYQPWYQMRQRFDADFFFCYGRMQTLLLGAAACARVLPVGLPKLDALRDIHVHDAGYLCWFSQPEPAPAQQLGLLAAIAERSGLPVRMRPHPALPEAFAGHEAAKGVSIDDPARDPIEALAGCAGFISTHSSALLEALTLGKPSILFPSFGLTSFVGYPNVARDFTAHAWEFATRSYAARAAATAAFFDDASGGRRFDHAARGAAALQALAAMRHAGMDPDGWWRGDTELRRQMASFHPLAAGGVASR